MAGTAICDTVKSPIRQSTVPPNKTRTTNTRASEENDNHKSSPPTKMCRIYDDYYRQNRERFSMSSTRKAVLPDPLMYVSLLTPIPEVLEFETWWMESSAFGSGISKSAAHSEGVLDSRGSGGGGLKKRYMLLCYYHDQQIFKVVMDHQESSNNRKAPIQQQQRQQTNDEYFDPDIDSSAETTNPPLTVKCYNKWGFPVQAWDLFVGGTLNICGRTTTLRTANVRTANWIDENATLLWRQKVALEIKLNKFREKPWVALDSGPFVEVAKKIGSSKGNHAAGRGAAIGRYQTMGGGNNCFPSFGGKIPVGRIVECIHHLTNELNMLQ